MKSFVPERERDLVLGLVAGALTKDEFEGFFDGNPSTVSVQWLNRSVEDEDPLGVELGLHLGHRFGFPDACVPALVALAAADWHQRHEDVVDALSGLRPPESVDALFEAATTNFPYRDYDDSQSLPVKCVWALRQVGTMDAVVRLAELSRSGEPTVSQAALDMLRRLAVDAVSEQVRDSASRALA